MSGKAKMCSPRERPKGGLTGGGRWGDAEPCVGSVGKSLGYSGGTGLQVDVLCVSPERGVFAGGNSVGIPISFFFLSLFVIG